MSTLRPVRLQAIFAVVTVSVVSLFTCSVSSMASQDGVKPSNSIETKPVTVKQSIPFEVEHRASAQLQAGTTQTLRAGKSGIKISEFLVTLQGDKELDRKLMSSKVVKQPVNEIIAMGRRGNLPSRGYFSGRKTIEMIATGYDPSPASNGGNTTGRSAIGLKIGHGIVAVDPKFIPLGTRLYVEGYGYAVAADTGGAIKGNRIDLGHDTKRGADSVGRRKVIVHILD